MASVKEYLTSNDFQAALPSLDAEMSRDPLLVAFAPIKVIAAGGFLSVMYLNARDSTGDLDFIIDPQWLEDEEILSALQRCIQHVAERMQFHEDWMNGDMTLFTTKDTQKHLFREAEKQNIILWSSDNLLLLAAPIEWALERKLRRIFVGSRGRKAETDMQDAVGMLKYLRDKKRATLDREYIRTLNANSFDVIPGSATMEKVAQAYREKHGEDIFSS